MKAIVIGILASFFFAFTFVLNRAMDLGGRSWFGVHHYGIILWFQCYYLLLCMRELKATLSIYEKQSERMVSMEYRWFGHAPLSFLEVVFGKLQSLQGFC